MSNSYYQLPHSSMEISCSVCTNPATKICTHSQCTKFPFLCDIHAHTNNSTATLFEPLHDHIPNPHNRSQTIIPIKILSQRIQEIEKVQNFQKYNQKQILGFKMKVNSAKNYINRILDQMVEEYEEDLSSTLNIEIADKYQDLRERIQCPPGKEKITGSLLNQIFDDQNVFVRKAEVEALANTLKLNAEQCLFDLSHITKYIGMKQRKLKFSPLFSEAEKLFHSEHKYFEALRLYTEAQSYIPSHPVLLTQIAQCYLFLNLNTLCINKFKQILQLTPSNLYVLKTLTAFCALDGERNIEAIDYYTKIIRLEKNEEERKRYLMERGRCYVFEEMYQQAMEDFKMGCDGEERERWILYVEMLVKQKEEKESSMIMLKQIQGE